MAKITFEKHRKANITIDNVGNDISFLMNPLFDNTITNLERDIKLCDCESKKEILECFFKYLKTSDIKYESVNDSEPAEDDLEIGADEYGGWCVNVSNISAEHSGYWYASQNLEAEKCSLINHSHILEGLKIVVENIDKVIADIRSAVSNSEAVVKLGELGLDMQQAKAILRMNITTLISCDPSSISDKIVLCNKWIKFIENLNVNSKINPPIENAIEYLKNSAMFQMSLGSKELFHSNFLQWIFSINPEMFKEIVNNLLNFEMEFRNEFTVEREYKHYDLSIKNKDSNKIDLIIENKVKSIPSKEQLNEYYLKGCKHLLLTIVTDFDGKEEIKNAGWIIRSYADLAYAMESANSKNLSQYQAAIINDYIGFIRNLNSLADNMSIYNMPEYNYGYKEQLKALRINDLIEKLRTCEIAIMLKKIIQQKCNTEIKSVIRKDMFETCHFKDVIINYGLTHAQGLVELKVIAKENNIALVVQVQGKHYCHAVELYKTGKDDKENWVDVFAKDSYRWFLFPDIEFKSGAKKDYNKYGKEFLYRYVNIGENESVENIVKRICSDYDCLAKFLDARNECCRLRE